MNFSELPVGAQFYFGQPLSSWVVFGDGSDTMLTFIKVSEQGHAVQINHRPYELFDPTEPQCRRRECRDKGSNFFPESYLFQWLNAHGTNWYAPTHEADRAPRTYAPDRTEGYLSAFSPFERGLLSSMTIQCIVPDGFKRKYGSCVSMKCKATLPSLAECGVPGYDGDQTEGFPGFGMISYLQCGSIATRTPFGSSIGRFHLGNAQVNGHYPCSAQAITPMIMIKPNAQVNDEPDGFGVYSMQYTPTGMTLESLFVF